MTEKKIPMAMWKKLAALIASVLAVAIPMWTLWQSAESKISDAQTVSNQRAQNFADFRRDVNDQLGFHKDQLTRIDNRDDELQREILEYCHK